MKLIIVRHGITIENEKGICQGQTDGNLSAKGIKQNSLLAKELSKHSINLIYTSPLKRAVETTISIQKQHNNIQIIKDKRLNERFMGNLQGNKFPVNYNSLHKYHEAESIQNLKKRTDSFIKSELSKYTHETILLVSHGITIILLMASLEKIPLDKIHTIPMTDNASISVYSIKQELTTNILTKNKTIHLFQK